MTLREVLEKLGKTKATEVARCGKSASWHWFQVGAKQKVPEMQTLVLWADFLKLTDADLGELVRDAHKTRIEIMEMLSLDDKRRIKTRSALRRDLAREIAEEMTADEQTKKQQRLEDKRRAAEKKQQFLAQEAREQERLRRLEEYKQQLKKIRSQNGNN